MYRKLRVKMTLFCTAVTGIILLFMTLAGLLAFKNLLDTNDRTSYEKMWTLCWLIWKMKRLSTMKKSQQQPIRVFIPSII